MPIAGTLLKEFIKANASLENIYFVNAFSHQKRALKKLLTKAQHTDFGRLHNFKKIVSSKYFIQDFQNQVAVYDYNKINKEWWHRTILGEADVCWPGQVKYFALTSGTSESSSKYIPVTKHMLHAMKRVGFLQLCSLEQFKLNSSFYEKNILMIGGCIKLKPVNDYSYQGDLSGILAGNLPLWMSKLYKPGKNISGEENWSLKIEKITQTAHKWDVSTIAGVPSWMQLLLEKIIEHYHISNIHEVWPNLEFFAHGGVSLAPYQHSFNQLLGKKINYLETYLASEGFIAIQDKKESEGMKLIADNGIFFEFIPFTSRNFSPEGDLVNNPETLLLNEVREGEEYALLISTCGGAWRYLIGDTIKFTSLNNCEIRITGRTKHFLSLCGEHLSVDNMNKAIEAVGTKMDMDIREYTVIGIPYQGYFAHQWYIGSNTSVDVNVDRLTQLIDATLASLNDDYRIERGAVLKEIFVKVIPTEIFYRWMAMNNKVGGQHKFPRVLRGDKALEWENYLKNTLSE